MSRLLKCKIPALTDLLVLYTLQSNKITHSQGSATVRCQCFTAGIIIHTAIIWLKEYNGVIKDNCEFEEHDDLSISFVAERKQDYLKVMTMNTVPKQVTYFSFQWPRRRHNINSNETCYIFGTHSHKVITKIHSRMQKHSEVRDAREKLVYKKMSREK